MTSKLEELSAAAAQGDWIVCTDPKNDSWIKGSTIGTFEGNTVFGNAVERRLADTFLSSPTYDADASFIVALVNAYRSGRLVEVEND
ncbi:hypothetical protein [Henriciella sp.]|uniref:hypothetical protein n=1 Tax=Henriciella sp. TaxID=1968823 RepID=UPI00262C6AA2|nr:hypothetical protein [Henriciella sp.]